MRLTNICYIYTVASALYWIVHLISDEKEENVCFMGHIDYIWAWPGAASGPRAHAALCCLVFLLAHLL